MKLKKRTDRTNIYRIKINQYNDNDVHKKQKINIKKDQQIIIV